MRKTLLFVMILLLVGVVGISVSAADDSGVWEYTVGENGAELTRYLGEQSDVYIPGKIEVNGESLNVTKLGSKLFDNNLINSATLGEGILEIGDSAFEGQTDMVCILTSESLTTIGVNAFKNCTSFNSVILYDTVTEIGENAFLNCRE